MISDLVDCTGDKADSKVPLEIVNAGYGYTVAPSVAFFGGGGAGAIATTGIGTMVSLVLSLSQVVVLDIQLIQRFPLQMVFLWRNNSICMHSYISGRYCNCSLYYKRWSWIYSVAPTIEISAPVGFGTVGIGTFA